jgi:hypothetical protein
MFFLEFAEAHGGPISTHKFNEAINGVFRSHKQVSKPQKSVAFGRCVTQKTTRAIENRLNMANDGLCHVNDENDLVDHFDDDSLEHF